MACRIDACLCGVISLELSMRMRSVTVTETFVYLSAQNLLSLLAMHFFVLHSLCSSTAHASFVYSSFTSPCHCCRFRISRSSIRLSRSLKESHLSLLPVPKSTIFPHIRHNLSTQTTPRQPEIVQSGHSCVKT